MGQKILSLTGNPSLSIKNYYVSTNQRYSLLFNGEIYNDAELWLKYLSPLGYNNTTKSDAEVLINLHETTDVAEIFRSVIGMYVYVVFDKEKNKLYIARDIVGEKILYYYQDDEFFILSSEIGPIVNWLSEVTISQEIVQQYLFTRHFLTPEDTVFNGIKVLGPGRLQQYSLETNRFSPLEKRCLSDLVDPSIIENNKSRTEKDFVDELDAVFTASARSITRRTPGIACVVSGGVDSSLAARYVSRAKEVDQYVSLQFPGKDLVSQNVSLFEPYFGKSILTRIVTPNIYASFLTNCYRIACAPLSTHSFVSQAILSQWVQNLNLRVLIGGEGADELFGGYEAYRQLGKLEKYPLDNPSLYSGMIKQPWSTSVRPKKLEELTRERWNHYGKVYECEEDYNDRIIQAVLLADTEIQLESVGLRSADSMSMMHSVESRSFFIGYEVLKFAVNLPSKKKVDHLARDSRMVTKPLLKTLFIKHFSDALLSAKQGFSGYPNESLGHDPIINYPEINKKLEIDVPSYLSGTDQHALRWKMINLELFLKNFSGYQIS